MRTVVRFTLAWVVLAPAFVLAAQADQQASPSKIEAPPPPGINDPGVTSAEPPAQKGTPSPAPAAAAGSDNATDPLAPLPKPDTRLVRDKATREGQANADRIAASDKTVRKQGSDTVEEYRQSGRVWMIRIVPRYGPTQTFYDNDGSGRLARDPREGPVSPVYYSLYEWK
jgi:Protein of unknown function (DUF2782)